MGLKPLPAQTVFHSGRTLNLVPLGQGFDALLLSSKGEVVEHGWKTNRFAAVELVLKKQLDCLKRQKTYRHEKYQRKIVRDLRELLMDCCGSYAKKSHTVRRAFKLLAQPLVR